MLLGLAGRTAFCVEAILLKHCADMDLGICFPENRADPVGTRLALDMGIGISYRDRLAQISGPHAS